MFHPRHHSREVALQILYRYDISSQSSDRATDQLNEKVKTPNLTAEELKSHFEHFHVPQDAREFAAQLVSGTLHHLHEIDRHIEAQNSSWKIARMNYVDRSLLRMSSYELVFRKDSPPNVIIDEAIELAKHFGNADTSAFVNGVLDGILKSVQPSHSET